VIRRIAHPGRGFTQGLITDGETVWESTGGYGSSALTRYQLAPGQGGQRAFLPAELFGEGICRAGDSSGDGETIWQLTWRERVALRWDTRTLELTDRIPFNRDGWGICAAGQPAPAEQPSQPAQPAQAERYLMTSDGSSELVRRDPRTLEPQAVVHVRCAGRRVLGLNDLAWSAGTVWANVAGTHYLAGIDPDSGEVTDIVNARSARERHPSNAQAIMNGIAALPAAGEFLLTGKGWRSIRHVRLKPAREGGAQERLLAGLSR
jgi:glutamine cyclotransferase